MFGIDALIAVGGLIIPPAFDFIKKKFLSSTQDSPEQTMSALATTNPDVLPKYVEAQVHYMKAQVEFFNRDVVGSPSQWVVDLRAAIRPVGTVFAFCILCFVAVMALAGEVTLDSTMSSPLAGVRWTCELIVSSWFGTRIAVSTK